MHSVLYWKKERKKERKKESLDCLLESIEKERKERKNAKGAILKVETKIRKKERKKAITSLTYLAGNRQNRLSKHKWIFNVSSQFQHPVTKQNYKYKMAVTFLAFYSNWRVYFSQNAIFKLIYISERKFFMAYIKKLSKRNKERIGNSMKNKQWKRRVKKERNKEFKGH